MTVVPLSASGPGAFHYYLTKGFEPPGYLCAVFGQILKIYSGVKIKVPARRALRSSPHSTAGILQLEDFIGTLGVEPYGYLVRGTSMIRYPPDVGCRIRLPAERALTDALLDVTPEKSWASLAGAWVRSIKDRSQQKSQK